MAKRTRHSEPVCTRPPIEAECGVCAGGHPAVACAGIRAMHEGGNAFDALVGAAFTAFVVESATTDIQGHFTLRLQRGSPPGPARQPGMPRRSGMVPARFDAAPRTTRSASMPAARAPS